MHTVTRGETLWSVSNRYNIVMSDIVLDNQLSAPFMLTPGQRLTLPPPREYRVRSGDSLYTVSRLFGADSSRLARLNDLQSPYVIHTGQVLRLPSESARAPEPEMQMASVSDVGTQVVKPGVKPAINKPQSARDQAKLRKASVARTKITAKTPKRSSSKFMQPVSGKVISKYGPKKGGLHNDGINILAARGSAVKAADNGVVVYAGSELKGSGNLVLVRHENRWMTAYAHLDKIKVKRGAVVKRGQSLGAVGSTGSVDRPQLHFEVRRGTEAINPERYLES